MTRQYFTEEEAQALVGKTIKTRVEWSGVPAGSLGTITRYDPMGDGYDIAITWDIPQPGPSVTPLQVGEELAWYVQTGKPLVDWFTKGEYETYLEEIG